MKTLNKQFDSPGFTLMELMISVAIVGILVTVALYSYQQYSLKSKRSDAINTILAVQLAEERYRSKNTQYGTLAQVWGGVTTSLDGYYTLSITNPGASSYTLSASAVGGQAADQENGASCATLTLTYTNGTETKTPTACWRLN